MTTVRSPYARDFVYRWQNRRGFGRLTMTALHLDEEWFCRAAWRRDRRAGAPPDIRSRARAAPGGAAADRQHSGRHQSARPAESALHRAICRRPTRWWPTAGPPRTCRPRSGARSSACPKGVDADRFRPDGPDQRARASARRTSASIVDRRAARADQERAAAPRRGGDRPRARAERASADRRRRPRGRRAQAARGDPGSGRRRHLRRLRRARRDAAVLSHRRSCSRCRPTSTTRRTSCSKRWRPACRS